jgi:hypothetical protein
MRYLAGHVSFEWAAMYYLAGHLYPRQPMDQRTFAHPAPFPAPTEPPSIPSRTPPCNPRTPRARDFDRASNRAPISHPRAPIFVALHTAHLAHLCDHPLHVEHPALQTSRLFVPNAPFPCAYCQHPPMLTCPMSHIHLRYDLPQSHPLIAKPCK